MQTLPRPAESAIEIPPDCDPRLVGTAGTQQQRLAKLSAAQRTALVLERYPELGALPNCDWQRLSARTTFGILYGESSRHFARMELASLAIVLASAGITVTYATELDGCVRSILDLLQQRSASRRREGSASTCGKPGAVIRISCARSPHACGNTPPR